MYPSCISKWESLAEYWNFFEGKGLNPTLLTPCLHLLEKPLALVGAGRGLVLKYLEDLLGSDQAWGFDSSVKMVESAKERGCHNVLWVPPEAPIPAHLYFKSLLVATGVLDPLELPEIIRLLIRLKQQLLPKGRIWLYAFSSDGAAVQAARQWGLVSDLGFMNSRFLELLQTVKEHDSFEAVIPPTLDDPEVIKWAQSALTDFDQLIASFSEKINLNYDDTLKWLTEVFPEVERLFSLNDLLHCVREASLTVVEQKTIFDQAGYAGVHSIITAA